MDDFITSKVVAMSPEFELGRLNVLERLKKDNLIIITNLMGYLKYLPNKNTQNFQTLKINDTINRDEFIENLVSYGYKKESIVTTSGEFSVRGFIIDIFLINEEHPIRLEFFGNTIESIRTFDENTQRKISDLKEITIKPFQEIETAEKNSLYDYTNA